MEQVSHFDLYNTVVLVVLEQKNQTNPSSSSYVTYVTVGSPVTSKIFFVPTMAPKKWLGVSAECTVSLHCLHPKDKIVEKIPNQTKSQKLSVLVVQQRVEKPIWPFGNEYHSVCCCLSGIMWDIDLVEGED